MKVNIQTNQELSLPMMGCGTWAWGNRLIWQYDESMDKQLKGVFDLCVSNGVTLFDTGDSYGTGKLNGRSEQLLGQFAKAYQGLNQENICIATKIAAYPWRLTRQSIINAGKSSSQRIGRNADLVQMHWSTANYAPWQEGRLLDGLAELYQRGLVKGIGLSNYGPKRLQWAYKKLAERGVPIATLQVQYSLLSTYPITKLGLKQICDDMELKLIAYRPLCLGILTGKFSIKGKYPPGIRRFLFGQLIPKVEPLLSCLHNIAASKNKTVAQVALNWCICKGTIPIPGAKNTKQAQENIGALGWHLDSGEVEELDRIAASLDRKMVQNVFQTH